MPCKLTPAFLDASSAPTLMSLKTFACRLMSTKPTFSCFCVPCANSPVGENDATARGRIIAARNFFVFIFCFFPKAQESPALHFHAQEAPIRERTNLVR